MDIMTLLTTIGTFLLGMGSVLVYVKKYFMPAKEVGELLLAIYDAISDGKITKEEIDKIIREAKDIPAAIKNLKKK